MSCSRWPTVAGWRRASSFLAFHAGLQSSGPTSAVCGGCSRRAFVAAAAQGGAYGGSQAKTDALEALIPRMRNIGIVAHIDAGKTTTTERMLYYAGVLRRIGEVDSGTTATDYMKEEMERGITIQSAAVSLQWRGHPIHLIDTPGHVDFTVEVERALRVVDGVVALFDASAGVQAQSYTVLQQSQKFQVPAIGFLNKMDKLNADFAMSVASIRGKLRVEPLVLQWPLQAEDGSFEGVVDLIDFQSKRFTGERGAEVQTKDLNLEGADGEYAHVLLAARKARRTLVGQLTSLDDALSERLIEELDATGGEEEQAEMRLRPDELRQAVRRIVLSPPLQQQQQQQRVPVMPLLCGASRRDQGVQPLLDAIVHYLPSPADRRLYGFTRSGTPVALPPASVAASTPTVALAFKVTHAVGPKGTRQPLVFLRVYSGRLLPRMRVRNNTRGRTETMAKLFVMCADKPVEVPHLCAGEIGAAFLAETHTGDTLYAAATAAPPAEDESQALYTLEGIDAPPPVVSFSVEAATKREIQHLTDALAELSREDPSLRVTHNDFGAAVLSGMGELHLDIVLSRLKHEHQVECRLLRAIIEYRETVRAAHALPLHAVSHNDLPYMECSAEVRPLLQDGERCESNATCSFVIDPTFEELYMNSQHGGDAGSRSKLSRANRLEDVRNAKEDLRMVQRCFEAAVTDCSRLGPLAGLPLHGCQVVLTFLRKVGGGQLQEKVLSQTARTVVLHLFSSVPAADLVVIEPMMEVEIALSEPGYASSVVTSLNERKAITVDIQEGGQLIRAVVALRNIVRYTSELRKAVKGHASYATKLDHYRVVEDKAVLGRILKNLGISTS